MGNKRIKQFTGCDLLYEVTLKQSQAPLNEIIFDEYKQPVYLEAHYNPE